MDGASTDVEQLAGTALAGARSSGGGRGSSTRRCARSPSTATARRPWRHRRARRRVGRELLRHLRLQGGRADLGLRRRRRLRDARRSCAPCASSATGGEAPRPRWRPTWRSSTATTTGRWSACASCRRRGACPRGARRGAGADHGGAARADHPAAGDGVGVDTVLAGLDAMVVDRLRHRPGKPLSARRRELTAIALAPFARGAAGGGGRRQRRDGRSLRPPTTGGSRPCSTVAPTRGPTSSCWSRARWRAATGPTLWHVSVAMAERRAAGAPVPEPIARQALEGLRDAWFFGLPVAAPVRDS